MSYRPNARAALRSTLEIALMLTIAVLIYDFFFTSASITGNDMSPTLRAGQQVLISRLPYRLAEPRRGDIVAVASAQNLRLYRVIGLPYERVIIRGGQVIVNGRLLQEAYLPELRSGSIQDMTSDPEYRISPDTYLLLNDNRANQDDSRTFGLVMRDAIIGRAWLIYWPPEDVAFVSHVRPALSRP